MNYTFTEANRQQAFSDVKCSFLSIPSGLEGFNNSTTTMHHAFSGRNTLCFHGTLDLTEIDRICPECGGRMHINGHRNLNLRHLCFGSTLTVVSFDRVQLICC